VTALKITGLLLGHNRMGSPSAAAEGTPRRRGARIVFLLGASGVRHAPVVGAFVLPNGPLAPSLGSGFRRGERRLFYRPQEDPWLRRRPVTSAMGGGGADESGGPVPGDSLSDQEATGLEMSIDESVSTSESGEMAVGGSRKDLTASSRNLLKNLANLSLKDYDWRSAALQEKEAERQYEESIARLTGVDAPYIRPKDGGEEMGPLGRAEKVTMEWLTDVIEEEAERARRIAAGGGKIVRPMDVGVSPDEPNPGPLGRLEAAAVAFINRIIDAETARIEKSLRSPKDLGPGVRGPLGDAEARTLSVLEEIARSEKIRGSMGRQRKSLVRPIDVAGPLGEAEMAVSNLIRGEQMRYAEARRQQEETGSYQVIRPKDSKYLGPLGNAEAAANDTYERIKKAEMRRLLNIQRTLEENRPMENDEFSFLGLAETITVGIVRAPFMFVSVILRVQELLMSAELSEEDMMFLQEADNSTGGPPGDGIAPDEDIDTLDGVRRK